MTARTPHQPAPLTRRAALTGLAAGAGALAVGSTGRTAAAAPTPPAAASDPAPGAMRLFADPGFNFAGLLALGAAGMRASEVGEVLTAVNTINAAGLSEQTWTDTFRSWGDKLSAPPAAGREGGRAPSQTRRFRSLRAAQYYAQALFYVLGTDEPGDERAVYEAGRRAWDTFCRLCTPPAVTDRVPWGRTGLPVWFFRPDGPAERRPTVILTNGSDGQNVDMWHNRRATSFLTCRNVFSPRPESRHRENAGRIRYGRASSHASIARRPRPSASGIMCAYTFRVMAASA
ncbi:hypothetical protein [Streptomyces sp. NRRL F-2664]|uniref:hypothetical protein n=1 Tax=Streptomyces sp. NRRL F-2664 TaxID=1463842 RepID=UPI000692233B|nr:hypothetical protein [Streptomyces sp. NRRL F-2664]